MLDASLHIMRFQSRNKLWKRIFLLCFFSLVIQSSHYHHRLPFLFSQITSQIPNRYRLFVGQIDYRVVSDAVCCKPTNKPIEILYIPARKLLGVCSCFFSFMFFTYLYVVFVCMMLFLDAHFQYLGRKPYVSFTTAICFQPENSQKTIIAIIYNLS